MEAKNSCYTYFAIEIVPTIYPEESTPCLAPNRAVIEFCYLTQTAIDIDLYVYGSNEPAD